MTEDIVNALRELLRCYDACQGKSPARQEINMWRERFLATADLPQDPEKGAKAWCSFLYVPSETLMETKPEAYLKDIIEGIE